MSMYELWTHVQLVKELDVPPGRHHKNVERAMVREWKPLKRAHFLCVQLVEHAMADAKQFLNRVMNVLAKAKQHRRNQQRYQFQQVEIAFIRKNEWEEDICFVL